MKETLVSMIHTAMAGCQSKQNWTMAAAFGFNSFIVLNSELLQGFSLYSVCVAICLMAVLSSLLIWNAGQAHGRYARALREFLESEADLPKPLVDLFSFEDRPLKACLGSITYMALVVAVSIGTIAAISCQAAFWG